MSAVLSNDERGQLSPTERPSARTLKTLPELLASLSALQSMETALSASLSSLLEAQEPLQSSLSRLKSIAPKIDEIRSETVILSDKVSVTAKTAERVGGRVRALDEQMSRIREAGERVGLVMELKSSLFALQASIDTQDWESATRHCARAMSVPNHVIAGAFAESTVPTAESHLPPVQTLAEARRKLLDIFRTQFEKASRSRDSAATSRFFKLFPAIGWEEEGLEAYSDFVIDLVRGRAQASGKTSLPMYYVGALTSLFESIAMIVSQHQPVVEKYYGPGKMHNVVARLAGECDRVVAGLLESWEEDRNAKRKLQDTKTASFSMVGSPILRKAQNLPEEDPIDPREVDKLLSELAGIIGRWSLFRRFLYDRMKDDTTESGTPMEPEDNVPQKELSNPALKAAPEGDVDIIESSRCRALFESVQETYYIPLETWYLRTIIEKSHRLSTLDTSAQPPQNTTPDDVFYILKAVLSRVGSMGSLPTIQRLAGAIGQIMEVDFAGTFKAKLEEVYSGKNAGVTSLKNEKTDRENRTTFMILLNDLSISSIHMETLVKNISSSPLIPNNFLETEVEPARAALHLLLSLVPKFRVIIQAGIEQLFNQLTRPKLRQLVLDVYKDVTYMLDQDGYTAAEYNDLVRKRFTRLWEVLLEGFKDTFTDSNYHTFFSLAVDVLTRHWEKHILSMRFTEMGAIRFDRDLRAISGYLSSQTVFGDAREKFQRLQQISTLVNLDEEEDPTEFYTNSGIVWRLSANDAKTVVALRT